jgi:hypothetical protein
MQKKISIHKAERLKKYCSHFGARIFGFWRGFGEGAGWKPPVPEPKRSQKSKRPLFRQPLTHRYIFDGNALAVVDLTPVL